MPLQATSGAASYDAFGGGVPVVPNYIEDVFSTYLYTGSGNTYYNSGDGVNQNIVNGIDLAGKGGMVWTKRRTSGSSHSLVDTVRGAVEMIGSDVTSASQTTDDCTLSFNNNGYTLGIDNGFQRVNFKGTTPYTYASWTFRKQPKFFDVVTYTGTGVARTVSHNLGSVPGCIIVRQTSGVNNWAVYHRELGNSSGVFLNLTNASSATSNWNNTDPTSTVFSVGTGSNVNASGQTYVAYIWAHDAGGFGLTGTDNVISCGSFTTDGSGNATVSLGYEPQWLLTKSTDLVDQWYTLDSMRGWPVTTAATKILAPNTSGAETTGTFGNPTATGFTIANGGATKTYIYIAIRRGPMKVPTSGTSVFAPVNQTGGGTVTTNFPVDLLISTTPSQSSYRSVNDRLRGASTTRDVPLYTNTTDAETVGTGYGFGFDNNTGFKDANYSSSFTDLYLSFRRAPSFFDEVCFTDDGTGTQAVKHNLGVTPELQIVKVRSNSQNWPVYITSGTLSLKLNLTDAAASQSLSPTSTQFTAPGYPAGWTVVSYLFASCPGVSKVGSYTGNGSSQTINCGFAGGARFVMIKATSTTGDWMVADSARGIVSGNDPYLELNNTNAEVTGEDWLDTDSTGFVVNEVSGSNANTNGATYIFLAIA